MFVDRAKIFVKAGSGGKGCNSFYKDKYTRYPRPDGGHGGDGGDVVIKSSKDLLTLLDFKYRQHFRAQGGRHGSGNKRRGENGALCVILIPVGTILRDSLTGLLIRDITKPEEEVLVAKGGRGGRGNSVVRTAEMGHEGEEREILLELKLLADVGIIGYPNVGKSSLINRISHAKSKVANYPFTTKSPVLGVVTCYEKGEFVVADIPGLIEDAHAGKGLGYEFLRHIERTNLLVHMIDMSGLSGRDPIADFNSLNKELLLYDKSLADKPQLVVANKMDIDTSGENLIRFKTKIKKTIFPISCTTGEGIDNLLKAIFLRLKKAG
ncbi:MAG: GTPase ObgE [Candidatus Omnitrophota bacterium]